MYCFRVSFFKRGLSLTLEKRINGIVFPSRERERERVKKKERAAEQRARRSECIAEPSLVHSKRKGKRTSGRRRRRSTFQNAFSIKIFHSG